MALLFGEGRAGLQDCGELPPSALHPPPEVHGLMAGTGLGEVEDTLGTLCGVSELLFRRRAAG